MAFPGQGRGPFVRPWALAAPVLVLLLAAPLLRPLLRPGMESGPERATLLSIRAILHSRTLAFSPPADLSPADYFRAPDGRVFAPVSPAFTVYLAGVAWGVEYLGISFEDNPLLLQYLLVMFAITLPTALAAGLLYRCGRVFELARPWRAVLASACVLTTGWFSYAVTLQPYAVATAFVTAAAASVVHVLISKKPNLAAGWLAIGGLAAGGAAVIEPSAAWALPAVLIAVLALPYPRPVRAAGLVLMTLGAASPVVAHVALNTAITGDVFPPRWHMAEPVAEKPPDVQPAAIEDAEPIDASLWAAVGRGINRLLTCAIGRHGVFSHFPILIVAIAGVLAVLHRHWPAPLKWLAGSAVAALFVLMLVRAAGYSDPADHEFAAPKLLSPLPLLVLCIGAWLRRAHAPVTRVAALVAAVLSLLITLIGAIAPAPPAGYRGYTAAEAVEHILMPARESPATQSTGPADRRNGHRAT